MNANDPNVVLLEVVAEQLGDELRAEMTFVGGAVVGLLISDPAMPAIRRARNACRILPKSCVKLPGCRNKVAD
jgi:hypothetical protein